VAEHTIDLGHLLEFHDTSTQAKVCGHMERGTGEAIETEFHPDNMNRKEASTLGRS
jgi:hypothetical protein